MSMKNFWGKLKDCRETDSKWSRRWLHRCLRFEAHNHKKCSRDTPRPSFSKNSSKELYEKEALALLTHDPEIDSNSSSTTLDESDGTEATTTLESSSSSHSSSSKNYSTLLSKMKRWRKTKHDLKEFSSKGTLSMPRKISSTKSLEKPMMPRLKRVSFNDSVKSSDHQDVSEAVEEVIDDVKETRPRKTMELTTSNVMSWDEHEAEQCDKLSYSNESLVGDLFKDDTSIAENEGSKNKIAGSDELYSRHELVCRKSDGIKGQLGQVVALFFFSIILLAYFRIK